MYKDKNKQREANRKAQAKFKAKGITKQGITKQGITKQGITKQGITVIPKGASVIPCDTRLKVIPKDAPVVILCEAEPERTAQGNIRVSKPGDDDYIPQCETTRAFIEDRPKRPETGKRGKDIKSFTDLPLDVQQTIDKLSTVDGKIDKTVKANRTAIAVNYQHLFPERYHSTGVA